MGSGIVATPLLAGILEVIGHVGRNGEKGGCERGRVDRVRREWLTERCAIERKMMNVHEEKEEEDEERTRRTRRGT